MAKETYYVGYFLLKGTENNSAKQFVFLGKQLAGNKIRATDLFRFKNSSMKISGLPLPALKIEALTLSEYSDILEQTAP